MGTHHEDFIRGEHDGTVYAEQHQQIPELRGGAYSVGFLCGYRRVERRPRD